MSGLFLLLFILIAFVLICYLSTLTNKTNTEDVENFSSLSEWNNNARANLCYTEIDSFDKDKAGISSDFVSFCDKKVNSSDLENISTLIVDTPSDFTTKTLTADNITYGSSNSSSFVKYSNSDISTKSYGYYELDSDACATKVKEDNRILGYVMENDICYPKRTIGTTGIPEETTDDKVSYMKVSGYQFTYSFWLKITETSITDRIIFYKGKLEPCPSILIDAKTTGLTFTFNTHNGLEYCKLGSGYVPSDQYVLITLTLDGKNVIIYRNEEQVSSTELSTEIKTNDSDLTVNPDESVGFQIGKLRLYQVALSLSYITNILIKDAPDSNVNLDECISIYLENGPYKEISTSSDTTVTIPYTTFTDGSDSIISAWYGDSQYLWKQDGYDATSTVKKYVDNNADIWATPTIFSEDPCPGVTKSIAIRYKTGIAPTSTTIETINSANEFCQANTTTYDSVERFNNYRKKEHFYDYVLTDVEDDGRYLQFESDDYKLTYDDDGSGDGGTDIFRAPSYRIYNNVVFMSGSLANVKTAGTILYMASEARPTKSILLTGRDLSMDYPNSTSGSLEITSDGEVNVKSSNTPGQYTLDNISYPLSNGTNFEYSIELKCYYVKLMKKTGPIQVAEVMVYDSNNINVAANKKTTQSSTKYPNKTSSYKVVDEETSGILEGNGEDSSIALTKTSVNQHLLIDLEGGYQIDRVIVYNRTDSNTEHIVGLNIILLDQDQNEIAKQEWDSTKYTSTNTLSKTSGGRSCQNWERLSPHNHNYATPTKITGVSGDVINKYRIETKYGDMVQYGYQGEKGSNNDGNAFTFDCGYPGGLASYSYNPYGKEEDGYSDLGGLGNVTCKNGNTNNWQRGKGIVRTGWTNTFTNDYSSKNIGDHNYCRDPDNKGALWCYTTDPRKEWEYCTVNGAKVQYGQKIYNESETFSFNMNGFVSTGFEDYSSTTQAGSYLLIDNIVILSGLITYKSSLPDRDILIDTLPSDYCPKYRKIFNVYMNNDKLSGRIDILPDGSILLINNNGKAGNFSDKIKISLDGIRYRLTEDTELTLSENYEAYSSTNSETLKNSLACSVDLYNINEYPNGYTIPTTFETTGSHTISLWLQMEDKTTKQMIYDGGVSGYIYVNNNHIYYGYTSGDSSSGNDQIFKLNKTIPTEWFHVAIVRDFTNSYLAWYFDGSLVETTETTYTSASKSSCLKKLGTSCESIKDNYQGQINLFNLYNIALEQAAINAVLNQSRGIDNGIYGIPSISIKDNIVSMSGVIAVRTEFTPLLVTLSNEYSPNRNLIFHVNQNNNSVMVKITPTGNIYLGNFSLGEGFCSLDGIMYYINK